MLSRDSHAFSDKIPTTLENPVSAFPDGLGCDAGQLLVAHRKRDRKPAVRSFLRTHAKVNEIVPIEGGQQQGSRRRRSEVAVRLALAVEVRHFVLAHESGHSVV